ncbi:MAG: DUF6503 family protein [Bacteroidota bacterium]
MTIFPGKMESHFIRRTLTLAFALMLLTLLSCTQQVVNDTSTNPFEKIKNEKIIAILTKAFQVHGGFDNWKQKQSLAFKKYFALYDEAGQTERSVRQSHHYYYYPDPKIEIAWETEEEQHLIKQEQGKVSKWIDQELDEEVKTSSLENTIASSTFVIGLPFKLVDPGVQLQYAGTDTLDSETIVDVIRADYDPNQYDNLTTPDIWWYYFDQKDGRLCAYLVQHLDHRSYVRNLTYEEQTGFLFPKSRKSYRVDSLRNLLYLRADYVYSDFVVR